MIQLCHCFQMSNTEDPVLSIPTVATNIKPGNFYHHNTAYCGYIISLKFTSSYSCQVSLWNP